MGTSELQEKLEELDWGELTVDGLEPRKPQAPMLDVAPVEAVEAVEAVETKSHVRTRRPRDTAADILVSRGESPAVMALFESMWKDVGSGLAREVGRPKASRQDAALGWYMLLLAMRARDAR
jgi:hypothetical protein